MSGQDTMTIIVATELGRALVTSGAASAVETPSPFKAGEPCPLAPIVAQLDGANGADGRSNRDLRGRHDIVELTEALSAIAKGSVETKTSTATVADGRGVRHELDRTDVGAPGLAERLTVFHMPGEDPDGVMSYTCISADGPGSRDLYAFSRHAADALSPRPLADVLASALSRELPPKRSQLLRFEDNGCEVLTTSADGSPLRLVRYQTGHHAVYATGPLSLHPTLGLETYAMAVDLGPIREPGGMIDALLCEPGDTTTWTGTELRKGWR